MVLPHMVSLTTQLKMTLFPTDFSVLDMDANVTVGVRVEETDVTSTLFLNIRQFVGRAQIWNVLASGQIAKASYDNTLPTFDFSMDVLDNVVVMTETIARQGVIT